MNRLHFSVVNSPVDFDKYIVDIVSKIDDSYKFIPKAKKQIKSDDFLNKVLKTLEKFGESNRLRFVSQVKFVHQTTKEMLLLKRSSNWMEL